MHPKRIQSGGGKRFVEVTDRLIEAWRQFQEDEAEAVYFYDAKVPRLRIRLGKSRYSWSFYRQYQEKTVRGTVFRKLGDWPAMGVKEARAAALVIAAQRTGPGEKTSFAEAFTAYLSYLEQHKTRARSTKSRTSASRCSCRSGATGRSPT